MQAARARHKQGFFFENVCEYFPGLTTWARLHMYVMPVRQGGLPQPW